MSTDLAPKYDPSAVEAQAYKIWLDEKCFHANPAAPGPAYTIVIPPPNVTGALHLGHAINNTLQDILTRMHRMAGFNTLWVPGIDHAGIATQAVVEKQLKEQENKTRHDVGREGLVERIWQWKQQYGDRILQQLQRLGCSCDWDRTRFTLDEMCAKAVRETFFKLFKDGLIYRGKRLVNWDTFLQTSISDDEIYHEAVKTSLWHIRYPIEDAAGLTPSPPYSGERAGVRGGSSSGAEGESPSPNGPSPQPSPPSTGEREPEPSRITGVSPVSSSSDTEKHGRDARDTGDRATYMVVATTRPETMLGDTAVAVHSEDPRWNWAIGKHVRLPLTNRLIPIIADDILVDPKFGTGVVKVTPAHDPNDYAVWSRHKGQADEIEIINILTADGKITSDRPEWSKYAGLKRAAARTAVVEDLKAAGLLEKEEPYETQVGHSDRSKTPVEPYLSDQWFVKMAPLAEPALEVVREGKIKFYPERHAQQYLAWLGEKRDWPVSRQLWWGHRIPVWSRTVSVNSEADAESVKRIVGDLNLREGLFQGANGTQPDVNVQMQNRETGEHVSIQELLNGVNAGTYEIQICLGQDIAKSLGIEDVGFVQDPDVLDTWFSSALWPHSTLGWPENTPELARYYPTSVLLTGRDIITLWVARMVMMGMYNMGRGTGGPPVSSSSESENHGRAARATEARALGIPFLDVVINPTILDGKGERMAKSKGNGVDPVDIVFSHGADALRFTLTNMATETQDARMPVQVVCPHCAERLPNPENKDAEMICGKCKKKLTRPINNATGTDGAPLARMTSDRFDLGRNFCNKLWNACRFALSNLESVGSALADGGLRNSSQDASSATTASASAKADPTNITKTASAPMSLADRWIISRFHTAVAESNDALAAYRFDVYAKTCYDFFWRDFCDWYVEAIKPAMKDPARAPHTANVLAAVLDGSLRLMHPMIPFITETVWWRLNDIRPIRGLGDLLACPPSKRLVLAQWPSTATPSPFSPGGHAGSSAENPQFPARPPGLNDAGNGDNAETIFTKLQELIVAIRTIRNNHHVNPKEMVKVSIKASADLTAHIETNRELIELLGTSSIQAVGSTIPPVANAVTANAAGAEIFVEGLIDPDAEKVKLKKEIETKEKSVEGLKGRLTETYVAKAPAKLVQQTRDQITALEAEIVKMKEALAKLQG